VQRRRPGATLDLGEVTSLLLLAAIAIWGVWFAVQAAMSLWFPLNALYGLAGVGVAVVCVLVGRALLSR
jgi:hypothetical protein